MTGGKKSGAAQKLYVTEKSIQSDLDEMEKK